MRSAVFHFEDYYPSGGWHDLAGIGSTFDELRPIVVNRLGRDYGDDHIQIVILDDDHIQIVILDDNPRQIAYTYMKTTREEDTEEYMLIVTTIELTIDEHRDDIDLEALLANDYRHEEKRYKSHMLSPFGGSTEYSPDVAE